MEGPRSVLQPDAGRQPIKFAQRTLQIEQAIAGHRVDRAELQVAGQFALGFAESALELLDRVEQIERRRMNLPALVREHEAAAAPFAQPQAEPFFQMTHMRGDRRLRHAQARLRGGKPALVDDRREHAQQPELDVAKRQIEDTLPGAVAHTSSNAQPHFQS